MNKEAWSMSKDPIYKLNILEAAYIIEHVSALEQDLKFLLLPFVQSHHDLTECFTTYCTIKRCIETAQKIFNSCCGLELGTLHFLLYTRQLLLFESEAERSHRSTH